MSDQRYERPLFVLMRAESVPTEMLSKHAGQSAIGSRLPSLRPELPDYPSAETKAGNNSNPRNTRVKASAKSRPLKSIWIVKISEVSLLIMGEIDLHS